MLLQRDDLNNCMKFFQYGLRGEELMLTSYKLSWLYENSVTILDDNQKTLLFNFPQFGTLMVDTLRKVLDCAED